MTAPASTSPSAPNLPPGGGPNAGITFDEIEAQLKEAERTALAPKLDDVKYEGEDIPENMRGKTAREALNRITELENTLRSSEIARQQALATAQVASSRREPAIAARPEPEPEPMVTADDVAVAMQEDQLKGIKLLEKMNQQQIDRASAAFMQRVAPMLAGSSSVAEAEARRKYPDEFEIYKEEIDALLGQVADKNIMSTVQSWDDMISFARGRNPMKLFDHLQKKTSVKAAADAQERERNNAGVTMSSSQRAAGPAGSVIMDDTTKEVCRVLGLSEQDYVKWSKVS